MQPEKQTYRLLRQSTAWSKGVDSRPSEAKAREPYDQYILTKYLWIFKILFFNISFGVFLRFIFFKNYDVTMSHHQILVQKLTIRSYFFPRGSNKLIFGENEGLHVLDLLWKNG